MECLIRNNGAWRNFQLLEFPIPVILGIVEDMKELCPDAWLINLNPSEMVIVHATWSMGQLLDCVMYQ